MRQYVICIESVLLISDALSNSNFSNFVITNRLSSRINNQNSIFCVLAFYHPGLCKVYMKCISLCSGSFQGITSKM